MRIAAAAMFIAATALTSCDSGSTTTPTPSVTATFPASATRPPATNTPASTATAAPATPLPTAGAAVPTPSPLAAPPPELTEPAPPPPLPIEPPPTASGTLTVVALNIAFDVTSLSAPAGPIAINFENQDRAVAHNIHFISRVSNQSLGMTDIEPGPATASLSLGTLAPGAYFYKCDVHPTTMTGILTLT